MEYSFYDFFKAHRLIRTLPLRNEDYERGLTKGRG